VNQQSMVSSACATHACEWHEADTRQAVSLLINQCV
jgi:hypothetical protein